MSTVAKDRRTSRCTGVITVGPNGSLSHRSILDSVTLGTGVDVQPHNETSGQPSMSRLAREVLLGDSNDSSPPGTDDLDAGEMLTGAHALLLVEDRFARHLLERWKAGRSSLHQMDRVGEMNQTPDAPGLGSCLPADHRG